MNDFNWREWLIIAASFIIASVLTILPLPEWAVWFRPAWLPVVLISWLIAIPYRVGFGLAFFVGIVLDGLTGTLLGEHAFALLIIAFVVIKLYRQIRAFPLWQQAVATAVLLFIYHLLLIAVAGFAGEPANSRFMLLSVTTSMLLWPWLALVMRDLRKRFRIH
jgi:rod shape-determining protein MreD